MSGSPVKIVKDRADLRVINEINIIAHLSANALERVLPPGLSMAQFGVLNHFARLGGAETPAELADAFQVTRGAMTNTLSRLEAGGLIAIRADDSDGRKKRVSITDDGLKVREAATRAIRPIMDLMRDNIAVEEFAAALPFLIRLRTWLDSHR